MAAGRARKITTMKVNFSKKLVFLAVFVSCSAFGQYSSWLSNSHYVRKHYSQVRDFEQYLFAPPKEQEADDEETDQTFDLKTHSVLIVKDGQIVYEKYAKGYDKNNPQKLFSISKSITNLLIGIAVKEKRISLSDNLCRYLKDFEFRSYCSKITLFDLLDWSSGIHWRESFDSPFSASSFNLMYTERGYKDSTSFILSHPLIKKPGESWHYSSGDTNLLMAVLSKVYTSSEYARLPWVKLFNELGIQNAFWDRDQKGVFNGCCSLYLTARDLARVGEFMLKEGRWMGRMMLPQDWVSKYVKTISPSFLKEPILIKEQFVPGFHWWVNQPSHHRNVYKPKALTHAPGDLYFAIGYGGQFLFIIPSMNVIIVRTGHFSEKYLDVNAMLGMALNIIDGDSYNLPIRGRPVPFSIGQEYNPPKEYNPSVPRSLNNVVAKEMCSCVFIERSLEDHCREYYLGEYLKPFQRVSVLKKEKQVKVSLFHFFQLSRAVFRGKYGCSLL